MIAVQDRASVVCHDSRPMVPVTATIVDIQEESSNTRTYMLQIDDPAMRSAYRFEPGQFNMVYVFGVGEAAISISSDPAHNEYLAHTIRHVGSVTRAIARMKVGDKLGLRGPFGHGWPISRCSGRDILMVAGGIGLAPIRPLIYAILANRGQFGRVVLMYGGRSPSDLLYQKELAAWRDDGQMDLLVSVDYSIAQWDGPVGVVTDLIKRLRIRPDRTSVMVCGPRMMNRHVTWQLLRLRVAPDQLFISLERNMRCGVGRCGHCQYGPKFVCKDGPVFSYESIREVFGKEEI
ncbi:MAG: FAD/NAD(P)-binding protein [Verrucomicrobiota bacterium]|nr:FAD/NAD(P)-binding protein [Verrucomicrobiota bacterium]